MWYKIEFLNWYFWRQNSISILTWRENSKIEIISNYFGAKIQIVLRFFLAAIFDFWHKNPKFNFFFFKFPFQNTMMYLAVLPKEVQLHQIPNPSLTKGSSRKKSRFTKKAILPRIFGDLYPHLHLSTKGTNWLYSTKINTLHLHRST